MQANLNTNDPIDSQGCSQDLSTGIDYFLTPPPPPLPPSLERIQICALILYNIYTMTYVWVSSTKVINLLSLFINCCLPHWFWQREVPYKYTLHNLSLLCLLQGQGKVKTMHSHYNCALFPAFFLLNYSRVSPAMNHIAFLETEIWVAEKYIVSKRNNWKKQVE